MWRGWLKCMQRRPRARLVGNSGSQTCGLAQCGLLWGNLYKCYQQTCQNEHLHMAYLPYRHTLTCNQYRPKNVICLFLRWCYMSVWIISHIFPLSGLQHYNCIVFVDQLRWKPTAAKPGYSPVYILKAFTYFSLEWYFFKLISHFSTNAKAKMFC